MFSPSTADHNNLVLAKIVVYRVHRAKRTRRPPNRRKGRGAWEGRGGGGGGGTKVRRMKERKKRKKKDRKKNTRRKEQIDRWIDS